MINLSDVQFEKLILLLTACCVISGFIGGFIGGWLYCMMSALSDFLDKKNWVLFGKKKDKEVTNK